MCRDGSGVAHRTQVHAFNLSDRAVEEAPEAPSNHPHNCQCRIVGLVSLGEVIHRTED
jgi:hypothetical protein